MATKRTTELIISKLFGTISDKTIAIFGFAFKRIQMMQRITGHFDIIRIIERRSQIKIYDPKVSFEQIKNDLVQKIKT